MAKLNDIVNRPGFETAGTSASKATIVVFAATFLYLVIFSDIKPGILGGAIFFVVGIFAVSLLISMPLFILRAKFPILGIAISLADVVITVALTHLVYVWLFIGPAMAAAPDAFVVKCTEPIPEFTLGQNSHPNQSQSQELCACVYKELHGWEKSTAELIAKHHEGDASALNIAAFPSRFGTRIKQCGGMEL